MPNSEVTQLQALKSTMIKWITTWKLRIGKRKQLLWNHMTCQQQVHLRWRSTQATYLSEYPTKALISRGSIKKTTNQGLVRTLFRNLIKINHKCLLNKKITKMKKKYYLKKGKKNLNNQDLSFHRKKPKDSLL